MRPATFWEGASAEKVPSGIPEDAFTARQASGDWKLWDHFEYDRPGGFLWQALAGDVAAGRWGDGIDLCGDNRESEIVPVK